MQDLETHLRFSNSSSFTIVLVARLHPQAHADEDAARSLHRLRMRVAAGQYTTLWLGNYVGTQSRARGHCLRGLARNL